MKQQVPRLIQYKTEELRTRKEAVRANRYAHFDRYDDEKVTAALKQISELFPACIVNNVEAAEYAAKYHRRVYILPQPVDLSNYRVGPGFIERPANDAPVIVHLKTHEAMGTDDIERAISLLQSNGHKVHYERVESQEKDKLVAKIKQADIVIDQLLHGSYGEVSIMAMSLGKPVLSHLRADLLPKFAPELPVVTTNPANIYRNLKALLEDAGLRAKLGNRGQCFYNEQHHSDAAGNKLMWIYSKEMENWDEDDQEAESNKAVIFDCFTGTVYSENMSENANPCPGDNPGLRPLLKRRIDSEEGVAAVASSNSLTPTSLTVKAPEKKSKRRFRQSAKRAAYREKTQSIKKMHKQSRVTRKRG
ncbi:hypothetical protein [Paenibacillus sp. GCM10027626]|uniref:hypothetical protein n=1 Tax=Paenibacillus sp. GCM10027626 TaxID=3273411 RepID=UPI0036262F14